MGLYIISKYLSVVCYTFDPAINFQPYNVRSTLICNIVDEILSISLFKAFNSTIIREYLNHKESIGTFKEIHEYRVAVSLVHSE